MESRAPAWTNINVAGERSSRISSLLYIRILFKGEPVTIDNIRIRKIIGYLPEKSPLYENMEILDYLRFFAALHELDGAEADRRIDMLLDLLNLVESKKRLGT